MLVHMQSLSTSHDGQALGWPSGSSCAINMTQESPDSIFFIVLEKVKRRMVDHACTDAPSSRKALHAAFHPSQYRMRYWKSQHLIEVHVPVIVDLCCCMHALIILSFAGVSRS